MAAQPVSDPRPSVRYICSHRADPARTFLPVLLIITRGLSRGKVRSRACAFQSNPIQYVCPGRRAATKQQANVKPSRSVGSHGMEWNGMEWNGISSHVPALISRAFWRADRPTRVCSQGVTSLHHACVPPLRVESAAWRESGNEVSTLPRMRATGPT